MSLPRYTADSTWGDAVLADPDQGEWCRWADVKELEAEQAGLEAMQVRMRGLLDKTADALHGGPLALGMGAWSWHDLPDLAAEQHAALKLALTYIEDGSIPTAMAGDAPTCREVIINALRKALKGPEEP